MLRPLVAGCFLTLVLTGASWAQATGPSTFAEVVRETQPRIVKIYGAGGLAGLEAYQSGFLISAEGHVLTVWSYVLDTDYITVVLNDGRKFQGNLVGADPRYEIAVLKIAADELPHFNFDQAVELGAGARVLAFNNLFSVATGDEAASVLHGVVSVKTNLAARRGAFETPYRGQVYVLDAMTNNPGAAGGVLTDRSGNLAGILGKELRNSLNNTWLNYAIPIQEIVVPVDNILAGKTAPRVIDQTMKKPAQPHSLALLGIALVPDILPKTPPFIERVRPDSPAAKAGMKSDDLILFINNRIAASRTNVIDELSFIDRIDPVSFVVQRGQELVEITIQVSE
jgi:S1-C subfamily serine protease